MINVTEIMKRGAENKKLPPWVNMRHAWMVNDGLRDKDLEYPENVVQIKNLDYKKRLDAEQFAAILDSWKMDKKREMLYASSGDASDIDSDSYVSNSLFDLCVPASYMGDSDKAYPVIVSVHGGGWFYGDKTVVVGIRPEDVKDDPEFIAAHADSKFVSTIRVYELLGAEVNLHYEIGDVTCTAKVNPRTTARPGDEVTFAMDVTRLHVFDKETENVITH